MKTILVVDDMAIFREPLAAALRLAGYLTLCASHGKEAWAAIQKRRPDLILLDVAMPEMDGPTFLTALRSEPAFAEVPVILLTAVVDRDYVVQAGRLGVRDYLLKTRFSLAEMLGRIRKHLGEDGPGGNKHMPPPAAAPSASQAAKPESPVRAAATVPATPPTATPVAATLPAMPPLPSLNSKLTSVEALKQLKPLLTRSQVSEHLDNCGELKAMSPTVTQLLKITSNDRASIEQVARVIMQDHAIALKILKLANSVVYTRGEPVESVQKAVMRIGISQIRQAVLNISIIEQFSSDQYDTDIDGLQFWEHSIACGLIGAELARSNNAGEAAIDTAFTMGLLHDVGRLVYAEKFGATYSYVLNAARALQLPVEQVESRLLLVNHADAMDRVLHAWRFPKHLINPIALHHLSIGNIRHMASNLVAEIATLALSNRLAHALLLGTSGNQTIYPTEEFVVALKLNDNVIERIEQQIPDHTSDIKFAMLSRSQQSNWPQQREMFRDALKAPLRPLFISAAPGVDAFRILFDRVRDADLEQPPNLAVVHFTDVRQRVPLTTQFRLAQEKASGGPLPLLILSPTGAIKLEDSAMANRRCRLLPTPITLARLTTAINELLE